jgi:hypothetical protein
MGQARIFFRGHRQLAMLLIACALIIKALVPSGFMIGQHATVLTVEICADTLGAKVTRQVVVPHSGDNAGDHADKTGVCPFSGLAMAALPGADALLLAVALAFILALGFAPPRRVALRRLAYAHPPLRGPPARI